MRACIKRGVVLVGGGADEQEVCPLSVTWRLLHYMLHAWRLLHDMLHAWRLLHDILHAWRLLHDMLHAWRLLHYMLHACRLLHDMHGSCCMMCMGKFSKEDPPRYIREVHIHLHGQ